jgi:hypothetical protein
MIVVVGEYGQLGNRLIVLANMIAAARAHGLSIADPAFYPYAAHFEGTRRDVWCRYPARDGLLAARERWGGRLNRVLHQVQRYARKFRNRTNRWPFGLRVLDIGWREPCDIDGAEFLVQARTARVLLAKGWLFRAESSFERHADAIRAHFTPIETHRAAVAACLGRIRAQADVVIGVHIRHGDYANFLGGRFYYAVEQYAAIMRHIRDLLADRRVHFLVCSNAVHPPGVFGDLDVSAGPGPMVQDMYALAACDYMIGPPSTFSAWASFHGQTPLHVLVDPDARPALIDFDVITRFDRTARDYVRQLA